MAWIVYIVRCVDGTLYTGMTNNLEKRLKLHTAQGRVQVELLWKRGLETKSEAMREAYRIKKMTSVQKMQMIQKAV